MHGITSLHRHVRAVRAVALVSGSIVFPVPRFDKSAVRGFFFGGRTDGQRAIGKMTASHDATGGSAVQMDKPTQGQD
ncbi:MAG TPA: hypothetical protein VG709_05830, partial [Actinomycetota bacterium]|nr:hypothetical protein [Actinomycetota bacterium]